VILRRYFNPPTFQMKHRLVSTAMTELHLKSFCPAGQRKQLMSQADAEHRFARE
jgi:hypothetical protein